MLFLSQFQYKIEHLRGVENVAADVLLRYLPGTSDVQETKVVCPEIATFKCTKQKELAGRLKMIKENQKQDTQLQVSPSEGKSRRWGIPISSNSIIWKMMF